MLKIDKYLKITNAIMFDNGVGYLHLSFKCEKEPTEKAIMDMAKACIFEVGDNIDVTIEEVTKEEYDYETRENEND